MEQKLKVQNRSQIIKGLRKMFDKDAFLEPSEDFDGHKGGIWTGGEGNPSIDGVGVFDYYGGGEDWNFGVMPAVDKFLGDRGWFAEWHDAGTMFLWKI